MSKLRSDEPPLGPLNPAEDGWLGKALQCLTLIDGQRSKGRLGDSPFCVFAFPGNLYVQFLARFNSKALLCEAVSGAFSHEATNVLTPESESNLFDLGFEKLGASANYSQNLTIESDDDLAYCARLAFHVLKQIYKVTDFGSGTFVSHSPTAEIPSMKYRLTIDKQSLVLPLKAILALFGEVRTLEFAEQKWTPFVFMEPAEGSLNPALFEPFDSIEKFKQLISSRPKYETDFAGFVRDEIEKLNKQRGTHK